jgi:hypothetical protein
MLRSGLLVVDDDGKRCEEFNKSPDSPVCLSKPAEEPGGKAKGKDSATSISRHDPPRKVNSNFLDDSSSEAQKLLEVVSEL